MDPIKEYLKLETRRQFFGKCDYYGTRRRGTCLNATE